MGGDAGTGMRVMYVVWFWLLAMTIVEVILAYLQTPLVVMLLALLGLSLIKAALIIGYFMHLKFERLSLVLTLIPAMVMCLLLFNVIFPDGSRVRSRGVFRDLPPPQAVAPAGH